MPYPFYYGFWVIRCIGHPLLRAQVLYKLLRMYVYVFVGMYFVSLYLVCVCYRSGDVICVDVDLSVTNSTFNGGKPSATSATPSPTSPGVTPEFRQRFRGLSGLLQQHALCDDLGPTLWPRNRRTPGTLHY